jgi:sterol desaturase/sphingolipid hydroxylase (fatty acid hydroxylase superfamily)
LDLKWYKPIIIGTVLSLMWILETLIPQFVGRKRRLSHNAQNLTLGAINAVLAFGLGVALYAVCQAAQVRGFGLIRWMQALSDTPWPVWVQWMVVLIIFDFWMYLWHMINHKIPLLWRFHSVHHSDEEMDVSSAVRFHTGEIILSAAARLVLAPLLGMQIQQVLVFEIILQPIILFQHSNVRLPASLDRLIRCVIVTPRMHWVHHSKYQPETDSNYSSLLSIWDRLFGTFKLRENPDEIELGLEGYAAQQWRRLDGMLISPFKMPRRDKNRSATPLEGQAQRAEIDSDSH